MIIYNKNIAKNRNGIFKRNLGLEILRMFLSFRIVLLHYYTSHNKIILKLKFNRFQVPCFFFISFYFLYPIISGKIVKKLKLRLERLLIPYIIHPIINWFINNAMFLIIKFNRYNRFLTLNDFKKQIIIGRGIYGIAVLWFHFNLIFLTLLFFIFSNLLKNQFLFLFQIITLLSYIFQYSKINYYFFMKYTENIWMSVGNLAETIPIAIIAFSLANNNYCVSLIKHRKKYIFISFFLFCFISHFPIFSKIEGFSSPGIKQTINSILLFNSFYLLPIEIMNNNILIFIRQITKYTQGIYYMHFLFQYYMKMKFDKNGSFFGCIVLYIFTYFASMIGFKIFEKTKLRLLFS